MLVLGLVLSLMAGLGLHLVVSETRLNLAFCDGVRAYYLAESGLVWGLAQVREALDKGSVPPAWPQPPANPFSHVYQEPHGFDLQIAVIETKGGEGRPGQAVETSGAVPGVGDAAAAQGGSAGRDGEQTGSPAARDESTAGASEAGRGAVQEAQSAATPGQAGNVGTSAAETAGAGVREYEVTLRATGWYGEGRRAVRITEARVTVKVTPGKSQWRVDYWRQAPP